MHLRLYHIVSHCRDQTAGRSDLWEESYWEERFLLVPGLGRDIGYQGRKAEL